MISNLIFAGYTGSKNQVRTRQKIEFVSKSIFFFEFEIEKKSSGDRQGDYNTRALNPKSVFAFPKHALATITIDLMSRPERRVRALNFFFEVEFSSALTI